MHRLLEGGQGFTLNPHASDSSHAVHAHGDDALGDLDAVGVAEAISTGVISSREATEAAIARIENVNDVLNAVQHADYERALEHSLHPPPGRLSGVPSIIKDNTAVAGLPTGHGSLAMSSIPAGADAPFTRQLRSSGLIVLGTSTMPEFGFNGSTEYQTIAPTRNPWDPARSAGGSSGGSAALVASGALPIAHGNDGGGSIRIPAAACGLVGLKPTRGRVVPAAESKTLPVDIVSNGVLTRTVRDTAHFLASTQQFAPAADLPPLGLVEHAADRRLRIGLIIDSVSGPPDTDSRVAVLETVDLLTALGHDVVEVPLPVDQHFASAFKHYWAMLAFATQRFGKTVMHDPAFDRSRTDALTRGLATMFWRQAWRTPLALRTLKRSEQYYSNTFAEASIDLIVSPTLGFVTPELGVLNPSVGFEEHLERLIRYAAFTPVNNASGSPALSLPLGTSSTGLPVGVHFSALHGDEQTLLELAYELEAARPFRTIWS
ncbi:amidase [Aeromicrobium sp. CF3.5]|uniref:amidase n=1 Tax=Aeromicrobium sp. CF3.5 TaxID=3373078 RepID=UPI003EE7EDC9